MKKQGFTLVEILIVLVIAGIGLMTVVPKIAENTILSNKTEKFFNDIIETNLELAKELNMQIYITGYKGSSSIMLHDEKRVSIPEGNVSSVLVNNELTSGSEYKIYFYPDGVFDHFILKFTNESELEAYPALHRAVLR